jgi:hypothetical protein
MAKVMTVTIGSRFMWNSCKSVSCG